MRWLADPILLGFVDDLIGRHACADELARKKNVGGPVNWKSEGIYNQFSKLCRSGCAI